MTARLDVTLTHDDGSSERWRARYVAHEWNDGQGSLSLLGEAWERDQGGQDAGTAPEVQHFIWLDGGLHGSAKLTATAEDGRIHREDGRGPWEPLHSDDGLPCWYRVSPEIAEQWTVDDDGLPDAGDSLHDVLTRIRREVSLPANLAESAIRAIEAWEHER